MTTGVVNRSAATQVDPQGLDDQPRRRGDQHDRCPGPSQRREVIDDALVQSRPDEFDEVLVGDPFQLDDGDARRCRSSRSRSAAHNRVGRTYAVIHDGVRGGRTIGGSTPSGRGSARRGTSWYGPGGCRPRRRRRRRAASGMWARSTSSSGSLLGRADPLADPAGQLVGLGRLGRLGDHSDDRLGVAGPDVDPPIVPLESQSIATIGASVGECRGDPIPECRDIRSHPRCRCPAGSDIDP